MIGLHTESLPIAWLSLDEGDSDPIRFLRYWIAALQTIDASIGAEVPNLSQGHQQLSVETVVTVVINDILKCGKAFFLVLDDYHAVDSPSGESVHRAMTFFMTHQPPQVQLVITTREDPALPIAQLRAKGQLAELRANDLRFTAGETQAFMNEVMQISLDSRAAYTLSERTEGWIAGLQLAAISLKNEGNPQTFIQNFSGDNRYILDYLLEEVFSRQPESIQRFLLYTSILERTESISM